MCFFEFRKQRHVDICKYIYPKNGDKILDSSCQDGSFLNTLMSQNSAFTLDIYGVDISSEAIETTQKKHPKGIFQVESNNDLPFKDETFDVIISSLTLHHLESPIETLLEFSRVLKKNGTIYLIDITASGLKSKVLNYITCPEPYHFEKFYSTEEIKELINKVNLIISTKTDVFSRPLLIAGGFVTVFSIQKL